MAVTHGKLANVCDEMSKSNIDEALLKNYVTGGKIQVEEKYAQPYSFTPTARLTFATNVIPNIKDKSDGFWRRILVLNFKEKVPQAEQNQKYVEENFWLECGELSGVFNWALEGAKEIIKTNQIFQSENSQTSTNQTKIEADSTRLWISQNIQFEEGQFLDRTVAYNIYKKCQLSQGLRAVSSSEFIADITNSFSNAQVAENPVLKNGARSRGWHNLMYTPDTLDTAATPLSIKIVK